MTGRAVQQRLVEAFASVGLKPRQYYALALLHDRGAMSQQALGEALEVDPSILVALLNPLEAEGLASRARDPADRRRHIVVIAERGIERLEEGRRVRDAAERELFSALEHGELEQLAYLLRQIQTGACGRSEPDAC
jgi:DNA-binding MarR family transcriptional regulator